MSIVVELVVTVYTSINPNFPPPPIQSDIEPPEWEGCPADITQPLDPGTNSAIVTWPDPTTSDNSGSEPTISVNVSNPELFSAGTYTVQYVATDQASNQAVCEFTVVVTGKQSQP